MSESQTPEQNIDADQVVVNNAEDGGGVDNNAEPAGDTEATDSDAEATSSDSE